MRRASVSGIVLILSFFAAQAVQAQSRSVPTFEVDRSWPKVPPQWKLGDASSAAIDAKDNIWVLHRPRTLKPEDKSKAAPPVVVFDTAGNYVTESISTTKASSGSAEIIVRPTGWRVSSLWPTIKS